MLIPALTIRPVPAQRRLPIMPWSSSTTESISCEADSTGAAMGSVALIVRMR